MSALPPAPDVARPGNEGPVPSWNSKNFGFPPHHGLIHEMSRRLRNRDELRFFLHWLRRPGRVGAVVPSSPALAAALAAEIDTEAPGAVVELGPGTGRVTRALLDVGVAPGQLVTIERDASFCKLLRERFPGVRIVSGEARVLKPPLQQAAFAQLAGGRHASAAEEPQDKA